MDAAVGALPLTVPVRQRLDFLVEAHRLTSVGRLNRLLDDSRAESSAEHSWHLALAAVVLAPEVAPQVDLARVMTMVVLHDLVEIEAGDVPIHDEAARIAVIEAEQRAAERLFARLPGPEATELLALWRESEAAATDDARFAKALDRLQPLLVHWAGGGRVWKDHGITAEQEERIMAVLDRYWPPLAPIATALVADARRRTLFAD